MKGILSCAAVLVCLGLAVEEGRAAEKAKTRTYDLQYGATLKDLPEGAKVRVWLPVPQNTEHQSIKAGKRTLPSTPKISSEPVHGNKIPYFETKAPGSGEVAFETNYQVKRNEVRGLDQEGGGDLSSKTRDLYLAPNSTVPIDGKPLDLLSDISFGNAPLDVARRLYDQVDTHVRYDKSQPGYGNGDVLWVCDSRFGNCTDFHSLFISWARAKGIPARFEIGFPLSPERGEGKIGGYHCWALFYDAERGWVPVDISEADKHPDMKEYYFGNLTEDRVTFTTGRDIQLVPKQDGPPLNYFVYPYVEVNGKPWPKSKIDLAFGFKDQE